jgi:hypothetical protein
MTAEQVYTYERPWRHTKLGGITTYIAICKTCRKTIAPTRTRRSHSGTHGEDYYVHEHPLCFIKLTQSNSGNREASADAAVPAELAAIVKDLWMFTDSTIHEIVEIIEKWLKIHEVV